MFSPIVQVSFQFKIVCTNFWRHAAAAGLKRENKLWTLINAIWSNADTFVTAIIYTWGKVD